MAFVLKHSCLIFTIVITIFLLNFCYCFNPKLHNTSMAVNNNGGWSSAAATWYGAPSGAGSDGGACGYGSSVGQNPFSKMISAGGSSLYKAGKGCGACYKVMCTSNAACSRKPVTIVITDECPGCDRGSVHFDLSGTAFGAMATSGNGDRLRNVGVLQIQYQRVECNYARRKVAFRVDAGSNPYYFATNIAYVAGKGELGLVELQQAGKSEKWIPMQQSWGATWKLNAGSALRAPLSRRLTTLGTKKTTIARSVVPYGWQPGQTYESYVW